MKNVVSVALGVLVIGAFIGTYQCGCPTGWTQFNTRCYEFGDQQFTFDGAQAYCEQQGANLVKIETSYENEVLKRISKSLNATGSRWIGLRDETGPWTWRDGSDASYFDWHPNEPNNPGEQCGMIFYMYNWQWNDESCGTQLLPLCEKPSGSCQCTANCSCGNGGN